MRVRPALLLFCQRYGGQKKTQKEIREFIFCYCEPTDDHQSVIREMMKLGFEQMRPAPQHKTLAPWVYLVPLKPGEKKTHIVLGPGRKLKNFKAICHDSARTD